MIEFIAGGLVVTCMVLAICCLFLYVRKNKIKFAWWKWALSIIWLLYTDISVAFLSTTIGENELGATLRGGGAFVAIAVVTGIVLFRFVILNKGGKKRDA
ncbi:MAG: hypothetical protein LBK56_13615 [Gracilibacteraceae bacterium]|jgi:hypothetical protein|nr:hypothetical protein [Gracilibacteraceae bacterium]